jgi:hypothetical protein
VAIPGPIVADLRIADRGMVSCYFKWPLGGVLVGFSHDFLMSRVLESEGGSWTE